MIIKYSQTPPPGYVEKSDKQSDQKNKNTRQNKSVQKAPLNDGTNYKKDDYKKEISVSPQVAVKNLAEVKAMQEQIIAFYKDLQSSSFSSAKTDADFNEGYEPFLNYMMEDYTKKSSLGEGTQYLDQPSHAYKGRAEEAQSFKGKHAWSLRKLLESLSKVGSHSPKGESKADGKWGVMTNAALKNIVAFAETMIGMQKDVGVSGDYKISDLQNLSSLIPENPKANQLVSPTVTDKAKEITVHIKKIRNLWKLFKDQVFEQGKGGFGDNTSQSKGFPAAVKSKKTGPAINNMTTEQQSRFLNIVTKPAGVIPTNLSATNIGDGPGQVKTYNVSITYSDLSNMDSFKKFLDKNNVTVNNKPASENLPLALKHIKSKLVK